MYDKKIKTLVEVGRIDDKGMKTLIEQVQNMLTATNQDETVSNEQDESSDDEYRNYQLSSGKAITSITLF
jgi:hypothetical protein